MWRSELAKTEFRQQYNRYVWFVVWPVLIYLMVMSCSGPSGSGTGEDTTVRDGVTSWGSQAILAYVTASPADGDRLATYYGDLLKPPPGVKGIALPRLHVRASTAYAKPADTPDDWNVYVTVVTDTASPTFMTTVRKYPSGYTVLAVPSQVPGPAAGPAVSVNAGSPVDVANIKTPLMSTLTDFFNAWLTGNGDLSRVANTSTVPAFVKPPASKVDIKDVTAAEQVPDQPSGDLTVGATVWMTNTGTYQLSYTLKLSASDGRWVVASITATPPVGKAENSSQTPASGP